MQSVAQEGGKIGPEVAQLQENCSVLEHAGSSVRMNSVVARPGPLGRSLDSAQQRTPGQPKFGGLNLA